MNGTLWYNMHYKLKAKPITGDVDMDTYMMVCKWRKNCEKNKKIKTVGR